jgi:hypothetical protein
VRAINSLTDAQIVLKELLDWKDTQISKAKDQRGLQIKNAGDATDPTDLVTLRQLKPASLFIKKKMELAAGGVFAPTCFLLRKPGAGEILYDFIPAFHCSLPKGLVGSTVRVEILPTSAAVYSFQKGVLVSGVRTYTEFGTLSISTSGIGTWTSSSAFPNGVSFNGTTDSIQKVAPASQDSTLAGVGTCLKGTR